MAYEIKSGNKKYLTLPSIEPMYELLGNVEVQDLFNKMMKQMESYAQAGGYEAILIPTSDSNSNRSAINAAIKNGKYLRTAWLSTIIPEKTMIDWTVKRKDLHSSQVYVYWERP